MKIDLDRWKETSTGIRYKITRKSTNWHYMIWVRQEDGKQYCPNEQDFYIMDDEELLNIYKEIDNLNCEDPTIKRYGFPGSPSY